MKNTTIVLIQRRSLLLHKNVDGSLELPQVPIRPDRRAAHEITEYLREEWRLNAICLFAPHVLSVAGGAFDPPAGCVWMAISDAADRLASRSQAKLLRVALEQMEAYEAGEKVGPFARVGWLEELKEWATPALAARGLRWTGGFRQLGSGPESALLRLETNGRAIWLKSVSKHFAPEYAITKFIAAHTPGALPELLTTRDDWRGWLTLEAEGCALGDSPRLEAWLDAALTLGAVQRAYIRASEKLLALGAVDYRECEILDKFEALCRRLPELMSRQPASSRAPRLNRDELAMLRDHLPVLTEAFFRTAIPATLVHGDPNSNNFIVGPKGTTILDWAESYVGHPFLSFEYLRMHVHLRQPTDAPEWEKHMRESYASVWRSTVPKRDIQDAFALVPLIAPLLVASRALDRLDALDSEHDQIPLMETHIRSLARVAFRALQPLLMEVTA